MGQIARVWLGRTSALKADQYVEYMKANGVKELYATRGNRGVLVMKRLNQDIAEFNIISFWDSQEAIRRFAGEDINKTVYCPEDASFLLEIEPELTHFDISVARGICLDETLKYRKLFHPYLR